MPIMQSSPDEGSSSGQRITPHTARHARPAASSADALPDSFWDRGADRLRTAARAVANALVCVHSAGVDSEAVRSAFAVAADSINDADAIFREVCEELLHVQREHDELNRRPATNGRYPVTAIPVVPDTPGLDLCPDPGNAQTPAEFMEALRTYREWAGKPSYRAMESIISKQCPQPFGSSTIHAALTGNSMPTLQLVRAVLTACGASGTHQRTFASAWRRLTMTQHDDAD
jgi:hypothetical protein